MAERRVAELEQQMARMRPPAQELEQRQSFRGQQAAPMLPRPLQVGANAQRQTLGVQPQMAPQHTHRWYRCHRTKRYRSKQQCIKQHHIKQHRAAQRRHDVDKKLRVINGLQKHPKR